MREVYQQAPGNATKGFYLGEKKKLETPRRSLTGKLKHEGAGVSATRGHSINRNGGKAGSAANYVPFYIFGENRGLHDSEDCCRMWTISVAKH